MIRIGFYATALLLAAFGVGWAVIPLVDVLHRLAELIFWPFAGGLLAIIAMTLIRAYRLLFGKKQSASTIAEVAA